MKEMKESKVKDKQEKPSFMRIVLILTHIHVGLRGNIFLKYFSAEPKREQESTHSLIIRIMLIQLSSSKYWIPAFARMTKDFQSFNQPMDFQSIVVEF